MRVRFIEPAKQELEEAIAWYNQQQTGLGEQLRDEIKKCINLILKYPEMNPFISKSVRRGLVKRFPYGVLYSVRPSEIVVIAVMHLHRRPDYWIDRIADPNNS